MLVVFAVPTTPDRFGRLFDNQRFLLVAPIKGALLSFETAPAARSDFSLNVCRSLSSSFVFSFLWLPVVRRLEVKRTEAPSRGNLLSKRVIRVQDLL